MKNKISPAHIRIITAMLIFGTVGIVKTNLPFPSGFTAMLRGFIGAAVILSATLLLGKLPSIEAIKKNLSWLLFSGAFIGINWILLFESFNFTGVAMATVCYYMAPIFVVLASPFILGERISAVRIFSVFLALCGMVLVSEPWSEGFALGDNFIGILLALGAALFYAAVTVCNKKMRDIPAMDMTLVQLFVASVVILPYTFICERVTLDMWNVGSVFLILLLGAVHTGVAYIFYLGSVNKLPAATSALFGYIDPIFAVILSALVLHEQLSVFAILGAVFILSATVISELFGDAELKFLKKKKL